VHLPVELLRQLDRAAKRRGVSRNRLITEACRSLVEAPMAAWPGGFFAPDRLPRRDRDLLKATAQDWSAGLAARRSKKTPPF
jgi:hypothetical protein